MRWGLLQHFDRNERLLWDDVAIWSIYFCHTAAAAQLVPGRDRPDMVQTQVLAEIKRALAKIKLRYATATFAMTWVEKDRLKVSK